MAAPGQDDLLQTDPPQISERDAERVVRDIFGFNARAKQLTGERDLNFLINDDQGQMRVLKIANAGEQKAILEFQIAAVQHLSRTDCAPQVPHVIPALTGETLSRAEDHSGRPHCVYMLSYIDGAPLANLHPWRNEDDVAGEIGLFLGRLDAALSDFSHAEQKRRLLWDLSLAAELREKLSFVEDETMATLATEALDRFETQALPALDALPRQVIHNDLNPHNLITRRAEPFELAGVIDFGDMLEAPRINDVAVAASYHVRDGSDAAAARLVAGYHRATPLSETEIDLVPVLIGARSVLTVAISSWRAGLYPQNRDYIQRNRPAALRTLSLLSGSGADRMRDRIHLLCQQDLHKNV